MAYYYYKKKKVKSTNKLLSVMTKIILIIGLEHRLQMMKTKY